jgi:hypothetical protein
LAIYLLLSWVRLSCAQWTAFARAGDGVLSPPATHLSLCANSPSPFTCDENCAGAGGTARAGAELMQSYKMCLQLIDS